MTGFRRGRPDLGGAAAPIFQLAFTQGQAMPSGVTVSRASSKVCNTGSGLSTLGNNVGSIEVPGLAIESAHTNLFLTSDTFAGNGVQNCSIVSGAPGPDGGSSSGFQLVEDNTNSQKNTYIFPTLPSNPQTIATVVAKAATRSWIYLWQNGNGTTRMWFDLANGVVGTADAGLSGSIRPIGNGWYACSVNFGSLFPAGQTDPFIISLATGDGVTSYAGDGASYVLLGMADLIESLYPLSHVVTSVSTASCAADVVSTDGTRLPTTKGSFSLTFATPWATPNAAANLLDSDDGSGIGLTVAVSATGIFTLAVGGATLATSSAQSLTPYAQNVLKAKWSAAGSSLTLNGTSIATGSAASATTHGALYLGCAHGGGSQMDGWLKRLAVYAGGG